MGIVEWLELLCDRKLEERCSACAKDPDKGRIADREGVHAEV